MLAWVINLGFAAGAIVVVEGSAVTTISMTGVITAPANRVVLSWGKEGTRYLSIGNTRQVVSLSGVVTPDPTLSED